MKMLIPLQNKTPYLLKKEFRRKTAGAPFYIVKNNMPKDTDSNDLH